MIYPINLNMKKILFLMAIALPFVFISSCGDDKDKDEPVTPDNHEYVDLGLPSGTLWATCNIGASIPEDMGDYFAWGETAPKEKYDMDNYKWYDSSSDKLTKYCTDDKYGTVDNKTELLPEDDAAYVNWGPMWRMPTDYRGDNSLKNAQSIGAYWSRTLDSGYPSGLYFRDFEWESVYLFSHIRSHGFTVRPVRASKK